MLSIELQDTNFLLASKIVQEEFPENVLSSFSFGIKKLIYSVKYLRNYAFGICGIRI